MNEKNWNHRAHREHRETQRGILKNRPIRNRILTLSNERAKRGDRAKFRAAMAQIPDVEPEDYDRLP